MADQALRAKVASECVATILVNNDEGLQILACRQAKIRRALLLFMARFVIAAADDEGRWDEINKICGDAERRRWTSESNIGGGDLRKAELVADVTTFFLRGMWKSDECWRSCVRSLVEVVARKTNGK
ncbi:hypothetical protein HK104_010396 [Borealophlyctis nickersoniae]|nr:hypothetical protein HK104_010396 [Borealophlyctis nickersoniae]